MDTNTKTQKQGLYTSPFDLGCGSITHDRTVYKAAWMNTPASIPPSLEDRFALKPGTGVKSFDREPNGMPTLCGRVTRNDDDGCTVIGYGWTEQADEKWVWTGSKVEFNRTWEID